MNDRCWHVRGGFLFDSINVRLGCHGPVALCQGMLPTLVGLYRPRPHKAKVRGPVHPGGPEPPCEIGHIRLVEAHTSRHLNGSVLVCLTERARRSSIRLGDEAIWQAPYPNNDTTDACPPQGH